MAKIIHKGMWIDLSSLKAEDRRSFITSLVFGFIASIFFGIHLAHIGFLGQEPVTDSWISESGLIIIRVLMIIFFLIGSYFYKKFYSAQDDFYKSYHNFTFAGGAYGFLVFGSILTIVSPYFEYQPTFYEFFLTFATGTGFGGYYFYKKYIA
tara:strand:- start:9494 stop:9949 length:456 start_codon:yes stop_codon:yes gene_type:complete